MDAIILKQILREYNTKRNIAINEAEKRKFELLSVNPKLAEIEKELATTSIQTSIALLNSNEDEKHKALKELDKKNKKLIKEKNAILKQLSKSSDYLSPHFECKKCEDTGYIEENNKSVMCSCLKQKIFNLYYNKSNIGNLDRENFSNYNPRLFSNKTNVELYKSEISPKENMELLKEKAWNFINNFDDPTEKNILFTGNTGLGKTFLSNCIAKEVLEKGKTVLYQTAPVMFDNILDTRFGKEGTNIDLIDNIYNVDLLIIDDLGTEKITETKISELFTIINTRSLNSNHKATKTIISTNLTIEELFKVYSSRIGSRLVGNYRFLRFFGEDLRFKTNVGSLIGRPQKK